MTYRVRRSESSAVEQTLVRLWDDNLQMRGDPREKFEWYYRDNPLGPATAFLLEHASAEGVSQIVGSCGVGSRRVFAAGQPLTAALFADFTVDKAHRTLMPAMILQRALCTYATGSHDFAYAFPNDAAVGIFNRIGLPTIGRARRYVKVLRSASIVRRHVPWGPAATIAGALIDRALHASDVLRGGGRRRYRLEWLDDPDDRFDRFWSRTQPRWKVIGDRSAAFLRWRFTKRPGVPARLAALSARDTGEIHAYAAVVEKDPGEALIADFLASSDEALSMLLARMGPALAKQDYTRAVTYFLGPRHVDDALRRAGFQFRKDAKFVIVGAREGAPVGMDLLGRAEEWYLTEADRDN
jgi:hypothetical protein